MGEHIAGPWQALVLQGCGVGAFGMDLMELKHLAAYVLNQGCAVMAGRSGTV
ncbi:MAG TPA: hypothetical protein VN969_00385 [Streptosporangiaceae bacterium]|jgi:hypothetical protein|nr:hypothetical protein [Streptosporangiaceae bacterium]